MTEHNYGESVLDFGAGDRVELHPATDSWARGDRYGTVLKPSQYHRVVDVKVKLDKSGRTHYFAPDCLRLV